MPASNFGVARTNFRSPKLWKPGVASDVDALAWAAEVAVDGGSVSAGRQTLVSNYLTTLKTSPGFSTVFDSLCLYAAENAISALEDIKRLALETAVGGPTFTTDRGYTGDPSVKYIDTGLQPSGAGNYTQDSAHFSFWMRNNLSTPIGSVEMGTDTLASLAGCNLSVNFDGNCYFALNDANSDTGRTAAADTTGHWIVSRTASNLVTVYHNGASFASIAFASSGLPTRNYTVNGFLGGGVFQSGSGSEFAMSSIGRGLTAGEALAFYNATQTYMTAVGA